MKDTDAYFTKSQTRLMYLNTGRNLQINNYQMILTDATEIEIIYTLGHNYFGKSVAHLFRRFINSEPISLKFCTAFFQVSFKR